MSETASESAAQVHASDSQTISIVDGTSGPKAPAISDTKLYFEDICIDAQWWSPSRKITGDDVAEFAVLTGDTDPLHGDTDMASPFGQPIAHGLLGMSVMAGLSSDSPRVATLALVEISDWRFEAPVYFGDQVRVLTTVESITPHGRRAGRVVWRRQLFNQDDRVVQSGRMISLVARRTRVSRSAANADRSPASRPNSPR